MSPLTQQVSVGRLLAKRDFPVALERPGGLAWCEGALWLTDAARQELIGIDRDTGGEIRRFACPEVLGGLTASDGILWALVGSHDACRLRRIDAASGEAIDERSIALHMERPIALCWDRQALWIATPALRVVERVDPNTGDVLERLQAGAVADLDVAEGSIWVADDGAGELVRLDADGVELVRHRTPVGPAAVCFDGWLYWIASGDRLTAVRP